MKKSTTLILLLLLFSNISISQKDCLLDLDKIPSALVNDYADILSSAEEGQLEQKLVEFSKSTSNQITVVTVTNICGYDPSEFTYTLGEKWKVGQEDFDNGIVLMVKPTGGQGQRHTFIATGYGLEAVIPDATAKSIVEHEMIPQFKNGNFYAGINAATTTLMALASKEFTAKDYNRKVTKRKVILPFLFGLLVIIIMFISLASRARRYSVGHDVSFLTALWLLSNTGHRRGGSWGNFNSGSGNFGGFGGFGGGSFGGGGAGGSW